MRKRWDILLAVVIVTLFYSCAGPAYPCSFKFCQGRADGPTRTYITKPNRQIIGDLYNPGQGRVQIRDTDRRVIGYIESDGTVTNPRRQRKKEMH